MLKNTAIAFSVLPLLIAGCGNQSSNEENTAPAKVTATHINQVRTMHLSTNDCPHGVNKALREHGFAILENTQEADARLEVNITRTGRNLDQVPEFGGFGAKASFSASVIGAEDKVLFTTSGKEGSLSSEELCEDIGDELAEKLKGSPLGSVN